MIQYAKTRFRVENEADQIALRDCKVAIISAYATTGEVWTESENTSADNQLHKVLEPYNPIRITGYDPDGDHFEPSWAAELSLELALSIATEFKQLALFYLRHGELSIHATTLSETLLTFSPYKVGNFMERLDKLPTAQ